MNNREILFLKVGRYIVEKKATIEMTAKEFNCSTSSIKKYINDDDKLKKVSPELFLAVKEVQKELQQVGRVVGGKNGQREPSVTDFEALEIAETMIREGLTLEEASFIFGIPTSTIHERIRSIDDEFIQVELDMLFEKNKKVFK